MRVELCGWTANIQEEPAGNSILHNLQRLCKIRTYGLAYIFTSNARYPWDDRLCAEVLHRHALTRRHHFPLARHLFREPDDDVFAESERITPPLAEA